MPSPFIGKLSSYAPLSRDDEAAVRELTTHTRKHPLRRDIRVEGSVPSSVMVIESGWACESDVLRCGGRQILNFLLPGDVIHLNVLTRTPLDANISALTLGTTS
ncbi:hypothetical protein [Sphingomonas sp. CROZ-RG-20F-R02-07]|uniref:hypothetical protein n=1 Tax=Sphingomonas sp. CROZ-RG-20F-R02-07 TaxID=2914832 RepID=UPI001F562ECC|nr:hypothetical protein [Sphingomonas sp. CROZ-RG-20F-R02-07]